MAERYHSDEDDDLFLTQFLDLACRIPLEKQHV